jgi:hypothetical protein
MHPNGSKVSKKDKKIYETFKGSSRVSAGRTFSCETFFLSSVQQKKVYTKPLEFRIKPYKLLGFSTKPLELNMKL